MVNRKIYFFYFLFISLSFSSIAQCLEGDCENGYGKSDLFYAIYEGTFIKGTPEGAGKLYYDDYTYEGEISKGLENGRGTLIYKNGTIEKVKYTMGKKKILQFIKVDAKNWKSYQVKTDVNCISGDCKNGTGTYKFSSGNIYKGTFVNFQPKGKGEWIFANGEKYLGNVNNGLKDGTGIYYFKNGWNYKGTYKKDTEYNGKYTTNKGKVVKVINGKVYIPKPQVTYKYSVGKPLQNANHSRCSMCNGEGKMTIPGKTTVVRSSANYGYKSDTGSFSYLDTGSTYSVNMPDKVETCSFCSGKGVVGN